MTTRVAINGLGRIGRATSTILLDTPEVEVVAVNDLAPPDNLAFLLRHEGVLDVTHDPVVSADIVKDPRGSIVGLTLTQVVDGDLVKVMAWQDDDLGYAAQMVRTGLAMVAR